MDISKMLKQAQQMQSKMQSAQTELSQRRVEASVGGGKVTAVANAAGEIISIRIAPEVVDPKDVEMLEDLVLTAVKQALEKGKEMAAAEMGKITGGMGLPGLGM